MVIQDDTERGAGTKPGRPGSLGQQKSSYCRPCRGHARHHVCGRLSPLQQTVALDLWRCLSRERGTAGALSMDDDKEA
jgi:hypothetical protein